MALRVYSTLTRDKRDFVEITGKSPGDTVTMYVCGPTVYKPSHIGHMVGPVIFDTVKRYLTYLGYPVKFVVNITDVDDKLIKRAKELNTTVPVLAEQMTQDYFACLKALNVTSIDAFPRATQHIGGMIDVIKALIKMDHAYEVDDGVYFDVSKDDDYGKLTNRDAEQMEAGRRLEPNPRKRNPGDFALWKSKPGEPAEVQFDSPFKCGRGRPGWHIECTCMAIKELGETLDIHGGGLDLQFPHHENELAQSESWTDKPFAHFWMHNGLLKMGSAKMAGSVGNVVNIADLLKRHSPDTIRFLLLSTHYRSPIEYSEERLDEVEGAIRGFHDLFDAFKEVSKHDFYNLDIGPFLHVAWKPSSARFQQVAEGRQVHKAIEAFRSNFMDYMQDDFNTGGAVGVLYALKTYLNWYLDTSGLRSSASGDESDKWNFIKGTAILRELSSILGLFWETPRKGRIFEAAIADRLDLTDRAEAKNTKASDTIEGLMQLLLDLRNNLRTIAKEAAKDNPLKKPLFDQTDLIRTRLGELGVTLEDRPGGTTWRVG
jgi:cysteinyl-tRNA synthetase